MDLVKQGFNVRIPTCKGLNKLKKEENADNLVDDLEDDRQLTTAQTSDTRLVTKVKKITFITLKKYFS